jgi:hypothetical protein
MGEANVSVCCLFYFYFALPPVLISRTLLIAIIMD